MLDRTHHMEDIRNSMEFCADRLLQDQHFRDTTPVYYETAEYAREHDELNACHASAAANYDCRLLVFALLVSPMGLPLFATKVLARLISMNYHIRSV